MTKWQSATWFKRNKLNYWIYMSIESYIRNTVYIVSKIDKIYLNILYQAKHKDIMHEN